MRIPVFIDRLLKIDVKIQDLKSLKQFCEGKNVWKANMALFPESIYILLTNILFHVEYFELLLSNGSQNGKCHAPRLFLKNVTRYLPKYHQSCDCILGFPFCLLVPESASAVLRGFKYYDPFDYLLANLFFKSFMVNLGNFIFQMEIIFQVSLIQYNNPLVKYHLKS